MISAAFQTVIILIVPALFLWSGERSSIVRAIPTVLACYMAGMLMGNQNLLVMESGLSLSICTASVAIAIPLLLLSVDVVGWLRMARTTVVSFFICIVTAFVVSIAVDFMFADSIEESRKIAGMLVGVYTGGTPNMAAIGTALGVDSETFIIVNSADIVVSSIYLIFLFTFAGKVWGLILPPFPKKLDESVGDEEDAKKKPIPIRFILIGILIAFGVVVSGAAVSLLFNESYREAVAILVITTFSVALSLKEKIRKMKGTNETGQYFLLVFCVAIGATVDFDKLISMPLTILLYTSLVVFGSVLMHLALAALLRIDRDTVIITSTAAIFGPAFVGPVAVALKNREIVVSGIASGLVGYAVGNYLGLTLAWVLS